MPSPFAEIENLIAGLQARVQLLEQQSEPSTPEIEYTAGTAVTITMEQQSEVLTAPAGRTIVGVSATNLTGSVDELLIQPSLVEQRGDVQQVRVYYQATPVFPPDSNSGTATLFLAHIES